MKFTSPVYSQASGSIAGITYSHNRGGMYTRQRVKPTNPNTTLQQARRNSFGTLSSRWGAVLTQAQRDAWEVYAQNTPTVDRLGNQLILTGQQMYVRNNTVLSAANMVPADDAPTTFGDANTGILVAAFANGSSSNVTVAFDNTSEWANTDDAKLILQTSRPFGAAVNFFKGPYQLSGSVDGDGTTAPTSPASLNSAFVLTAGQKCSARLRCALPDGRISAPQYFASIVV